jgi:hypothetical protein
VGALHQEGRRGLERGGPAPSPPRRRIPSSTPRASAIPSSGGFPPPWPTPTDPASPIPAAARS